jgi:hypothetical protein
MARIRTLKPEIVEDEKLGRCTRDARLLFILCITIADDAGRFRASARYLRSTLFPYDGDDLDPVSVAAWRDELVAEGLVRLYESHDEAFAELPGWTKHQRIDNARRLLHPVPPWAETTTNGANGHGTSPNCSEDFGGIPLDRDRDRDREGEQGRGSLPRRGKGEGTARARARDATTPPTRTRPPASPLPNPEEFHSLWNGWPAGKRRHRAETEFAWALLIDHGEDPDDIVASARRWWSHWATAGTPTRWIMRPDRWMDNGDWRDDPPVASADSPQSARRNQAVAEIQQFLDGGER